MDATNKYRETVPTQEAMNRLAELFNSLHENIAQLEAANIWYPTGGDSQPHKFTLAGETYQPNSHHRGFSIREGSLYGNDTIKTLKFDGLYWEFETPGLKIGAIEIQRLQINQNWGGCYVKAERKGTNSWDTLPPATNDKVKSAIDEWLPKAVKHFFDTHFKRAIKNWLVYETRNHMSRSHGATFTAPTLAKTLKIELQFPAHQTIELTLD